MKTVSLKKAVELVFPDATNIEEKSGYNMRTVWFDLNGQTMYLHTDKVGMQGANNIYYRTAKNRKDYTGGANQWNFVNKLNELGYNVCIASKRCDYNRG